MAQNHSTQICSLSWLTEQVWRTAPIKNSLRSWLTRMKTLLRGAICDSAWKKNLATAKRLFAKFCGSWQLSETASQPPTLRTIILPAGLLLTFRTARLDLLKSIVSTPNVSTTLTRMRICLPTNPWTSGKDLGLTTEIVSQFRPSLDDSQVRLVLAIPSKSAIDDVFEVSVVPSNGSPTIMASPSTGSSTLITTSDGAVTNTSRVPRLSMYDTTARNAYPTSFWVSCRTPLQLKGTTSNCFAFLIAAR